MNEEAKEFCHTMANKLSMIDFLILKLKKANASEELDKLADYSSQAIELLNEYKEAVSK